MLPGNKKIFIRHAFGPCTMEQPVSDGVPFKSAQGHGGSIDTGNKIETSRKGTYKIRHVRA